jgi:hypothetical protein
MSNITICYQLSFEDYMRAQRLRVKSNSKLHFAYFLSWWGLPAVGLLSIGFVVLMWHRQFLDHTVLLLFLAMGISFVYSRFYLARVYKVVYRKTKWGNGDAKMSFRDENILLEKPDFSKTEYSWNAAKSWRENTELLIVEVGVTFLTIPKRAMSESQLNDLRGLLRRKVNPVVS